MSEVSKYFYRYFPPGYFADYFPEVPETPTGSSDLPPELMNAFRHRSRRERGRQRAHISDDAEVFELVSNVLNKLAL